MRLLNFTIIKLTCCLALGILIASTTYIPNSVLTCTTIILLGFLFILYLVARKQFLKTIWFGITAFLLMVTIGILTTNLHNEENFSNHYTKFISKENDNLNTITFRIREILKPSVYDTKYIVDVLKIDGHQVTGKSLLNISKNDIQEPLQVDAFFISKTQFKDLNPPLNPFQFDYKKYLKKKYIYHQLKLSNQLILPVKSDKHTLFGIAADIHLHINKKLEQYHFKPDERAIINALLLGQRQDISEDIYTSYANAGAIHILAVSGLHVGIILILLSLVFKPIEHFKHGKLIKTILLVCLLWSFALIAGLSASVTRAVTMFSIITIAINLKRPTNIYNTLAISMFVILLFKPLFLFDVGFQLSYLAVLAIVTFDPLIYKLWKPKNKVLNFYWHTFTVTVSAQLGIIPLSLYYFHQFPGLFFVSNLVIIPLLGFILGAGVLVIFLAVLNILPDIIARAYGFIIRLMNNFVTWVSNQEAFLFSDISFSLSFVLVSYILIISTAVLLFKRNFYNLRIFLIAILMLQGALIYSKFSSTSNEFVIFHKSRYTILSNTANNSTNLAHNIESSAKNSTIKNYIIGNHITNSTEEDSIKPFYKLNNKTLFIIDSLAIYNIKSVRPDYILLIQSPKINLNRLIDSLKPKQIIADGSNYKSYIKNWELICKKRKLPFHQTSKKGAFIIKY
jgi:competence protein ComEC